MDDPRANRVPCVQTSPPRSRRASSSSRTPAERDFLQELVDAPLAYTALLRRAESDERTTVLAACTFVLHADAKLCELQLLAVSSRHSRRGLGSLLLRSVERWLQASGAKHVVALAGLDTVEFWQKRGFSSEVTLEPEMWALLRDPFGSSTMLAKQLVGQHR